MSKLTQLCAIVIVIATFVALTTEAQLTNKIGKPNIFETPEAMGLYAKRTNSPADWATFTNYYWSRYHISILGPQTDAERREQFNKDIAYLEKSALRIGSNTLVVAASLPFATVSSSEALILSVVYSNRSAQEVDLRCPFQWGTISDGLRGGIKDGQGVEIWKSGERTGPSTGRVNMAPGSTVSNTVAIPASAVPTNPGRYALHLEYASGGVSAYGFMPHLRAIFPPLEFTVSGGSVQRVETDQ